MYFRPQYWADFLRGFVARHGAAALRPAAHRIALAVKRGRREVIRAGIGNQPFTLRTGGGAGRVCVQRCVASSLVRRAPL